MAQTNNVYYMVFAISSDWDSKFILHKKGNKLELDWNWCYCCGMHPYVSKRLFSAKCAANRIRWKYREGSLKEIYVVKFTPTKNSEVKEEKVFSITDFTNFKHIY